MWSTKYLFFLLVGVSAFLFICLTIYVGKTTIMQPSRYPVAAHWLPPRSEVKNRGQQETLAQYVWKQCQKRTMVKPSAPLPNLAHILVDDKHKMLYCFIPKVACTNWRRVLLVLTGHLNASRMMHINPHFMPHVKWPRPLSHYNRSDIEYRLHNYFKFMVVRDPLERVLSAWRDKFQRKDSLYFRRRYLQIMLEKYPAIQKRANLTNEPGALDKVMIHFDEFLQYIVDKSGSLNEHWNPYQRLCRPCSVHYDFVAQYETLDADAAHVLKQVNADGEVSFPARSVGYKDEPTSLSIKEYYQQVSASLLKQIIELYKTDFALFNFSIPNYLKNLSNQFDTS